MSLVRGKLKKGYYISKRSEKVYICDIKKGKLIYAKSKGKDSKRFKDLDSAYAFLKKHDLEKYHKVIHVR